MSPRCTRRIGALGALALLLAACDTTVEPPAPPGGGGSTTPSTIAIALDRTATTVAAGESTQPVRVTLTRAGAATGAVDLTIAGLPAGVRASITPTTLSGTATSAVVDLTVTTTAPAATSSATVTATSGTLSATATLAVTVRRP